MEIFKLMLMWRGVTSQARFVSATAKISKKMSSMNMFNVSFPTGFPVSKSYQCSSFRSCLLLDKVSALDITRFFILAISYFVLIIHFLVPQSSVLKSIPLTVFSISMGIVSLQREMNGHVVKAEVRKLTSHDLLA